MYWLFSYNYMFWGRLDPLETGGFVFSKWLPVSFHVYKLSFVVQNIENENQNYKKVIEGLCIAEVISNNLFFRLVIFQAQ